jgi:glycolate oxidase FAD binding subunit
VLTGVDLSPYVIGGQPGLAAVFPSSIDEVSAVLAAANEAGVPVTPWGGGTAITVGCAGPGPGLIVSLQRLCRVVEHEPGDLTATVEAGITVARFQEAVAVRGQWLSLDPPHAETATIGGVLAANAAGPRRHLYGTARDLVIGLTVVCADGAVVKGGGKVVKNVAGYDLPKLFIGSFGTLGVIVTATVKLRPRPDVERLMAASFDDVKTCGLAVRAVLMSDLVPTAVDLVDAEAARTLGIGENRPAMVVGFDGLAEQVAWQSQELAHLVAEAGAAAPLSELSPEMWTALPLAAARAIPAPTALVRLSVLPARVAEVIEQCAAAARAVGLRAAFNAQAGVGSISAALSGDHPEARAPGGGPLSSPGTTIDGRETTTQSLDRIVATLGDWRTAARAAGGHAVIESAALAIKERIDPWDQPGSALRIMRRIKAELDPKGILNPNRMLGL